MMDWKKAALKLKTVLEDRSIDSYFKQATAQQLRERYNSKERTKELYEAIMKL